MTLQAEIDTAFTFFVRLVTDADRDAPATGKTLTVYQIKPGETAFTDVTATTTETEAEDGIYAITLTAGLMDTAGTNVIKITGNTDTDEYYERIQVVDSSALVARAATLTSAVMNQIADHVLRRSMATARASSDGDTVAKQSLLGAIAKDVNKTALSDATLTVYEENNSTPFYTQTVTTDANADPVTSVT